MHILGGEGMLFCQSHIHYTCQELFYILLRIKTHKLKLCTSSSQEPNVWYSLHFTDHSTEHNGSKCFRISHLNIRMVSGLNDIYKILN